MYNCFKCLFKTAMIYYHIFQKEGLFLLKKYTIKFIKLICMLNFMKIMKISKGN